MIKTYGIYAIDFSILKSGVLIEIAEFKKRRSAEKAVEYLEKNLGGKYKIYDEIVFENFKEFKERTERQLKEAKVKKYEYQ